MSARNIIFISSRDKLIMLSNIIAYVISSLQYKLSSYQYFIMEHSHNKCMPQSKQHIVSLWLSGKKSTRLQGIKKWKLRYTTKRHKLLIYKVF